MSNKRCTRQLFGSAATVILTMLLVAGCVGDPSPAQPPGSATATGSGASGPAMITSTPVKLHLKIVNVCGLLTRAEIEGAVGPGNWNPQKREGVNALSKACDFMQEVTLVVGLPEVWEMERVTSAGQTSISGVGDEAFITERTLVANLKGRGIVKLSLFNVDAPYNPEQAQELVRKVIQRLP